jgi:hypothetical protein
MKQTGGKIPHKHVFHDLTSTVREDRQDLPLTLEIWWCQDEGQQICPVQAVVPSAENGMHAKAGD